MKLRPTKRFAKVIAKLEQDKRQATQDALETFLRSPRSPGLHFEKLKGHKDIHTIRVNIHDRVFLKATEEPDTFTLFDVGPHDLYSRAK